jgi:methylmalonyl-CoA mutase
MTDDLPLAAEFPQASREDWLKLVRAALKDRPYERLVSRTYDGLAIEPLYGRTAGARAIAGRAGPWQVMVRVDHPDPAIANAEALHELENGATGLSLVFEGAIGAYGYGLPPTPEALARALAGIEIDAIAVELDIAEPSKHAADHLAALSQQRGMAPDRLDICFGHDAIGAHAFSGSCPLHWKDLSPLFAGHVASLAKQGFRRTLTTADGRLIHNAGGSEAQELAFVLAVGVAYLRALEGAGIGHDAARRMIGFRLAADADQIMTIAKFRALRQLWARVEQACGLDAKPIPISAETAWRMMTRHDPFVNILRATIAAFAAGVGGADSITVLPFTQALGLPDRFARRVARNTGLLLLEESNLARVEDPAAGAGGIEDLTRQLANAAWKEFQAIEAAGGAGAAVEKGLIQEKVAAVRDARDAAVAHRKDALTGTSDYPDLAELPVAVLDVKPVTPGAPTGAVTYPALRPIRLAASFEELRDASDRMLARDGARPKVFLANLGTLAEFTVRATFARNFFGAGGIETVTSDGYKSRDDMIEAFKRSGSKLACLCSTDARYATEAADAAKALKTAGATHICLAGRPKEAETLNAAGVDGFIHAGCDVLAALRAAHAAIAR